MKNRDNFIDLMEEIDLRHLDEHIKKNTDTKAKRIKRYVTAAGIYVAACVAVLLLIPVIINHTGIGQPNNSPGANPVITDSVDGGDAIDEFFEDTKLYKVLDAAEARRKDVERLQVEKHQIVDGNVYYHSTYEIYRNTDDKPILNDELPIGKFSVNKKYIAYTTLSDADCIPPIEYLYCYDTETNEKNYICFEVILFLDFIDGKLVYVTSDSNGLEVHGYNPVSEESELISSIPAEWDNISSVYYTGDMLVAVLYNSENEIPYAIKEYNVQNKEWKGHWAISNEVKFAFADPRDGYYYSCEWSGFGDSEDSEFDERVCKRDVDGVWFMNPNTNEKQKVTGATYDELYFVNGKLVGVNGDEVSVVVKNHSAEKYGNLEEGMVFPRPESMTISYGWKSAALVPGDELYEYMYERMNARVNGGSLTEVSGRERPDVYIYREEGVVRVEFYYYDDRRGAPFYPDIENSDTAFALHELHFPITGDNSDVVFFTERDLVTGPPYQMCFGTLTVDPEIEAKILEYFE
ncbi:MAG: hypothetical protein E7578_08940 [Ruminococcaceae bacterium]|nr:hypothetical protein [Oscillospiraceae bacterium]